MKKTRLIDACKGPDDNLLGRHFVLQGGKFTIVYRGKPRIPPPQGVVAPEDMIEAVCYISLSGCWPLGEIVVFSPDCEVSMEAPQQTGMRL